MATYPNNIPISNRESSGPSRVDDVLRELDVPTVAIPGAGVIPNSQWEWIISSIAKLDSRLAVSEQRTADHRPPPLPDPDPPYALPLSTASRDAQLPPPPLHTGVFNPHFQHQPYLHSNNPQTSHFQEITNINRHQPFHYQDVHTQNRHPQPTFFPQQPGHYMSLPPYGTDSFGQTRPTTGYSPTTFLQPPQTYQKLPLQPPQTYQKLPLQPPQTYQKPPLQPPQTYPSYNGGPTTYSGYVDYKRRIPQPPDPAPPYGAPTYGLSRAQTQMQETIQPVGQPPYTEQPTTRWCPLPGDNRTASPLPTTVIQPYRDCPMEAVVVHDEAIVVEKVQVKSCCEVMLLNLKSCDGDEHKGVCNKYGEGERSVQALAEFVNNEGGTNVKISAVPSSVVVFTSGNLGEDYGADKDLDDFVTFLFEKCGANRDAKGQLTRKYGREFMKRSRSSLFLKSFGGITFFLIIAFDSGGDIPRCSSLLIGFHLEDKVDFNRGGVDT